MEPELNNTTEPVATPTSPATSSAPTTLGAPTQTPPATPTGTQPPATGGPDGWVPSYRLREAREAAVRESQTRYKELETNYQNQLRQVQSQLQALVGVQPPKDPEISQVRDQFGKLYPGLSKIEERANDILSILERAGDLESQNNHYWQSYGRQTMDKLFTHAAESLGAPLTNEAKDVLHKSFVGFIQGSPEREARYATDPTIVEDFWKAFSSSFIDPARRVSSAALAGRAPGALPQDTAGGVPRTSPPPQHATLDERVGSAWTQYEQNRKA